MKTKSLTKAIEKAGFKVSQTGTQNWVQNGNTILSFFDFDGEAQCLKTRPADNYGDDNPFNGNCYNFFHSSIRSAVAKLSGDWHGARK